MDEKEMFLERKRELSPSYKKTTSQNEFEVIIINIQITYFSFYNSSIVALV